MTISRRLLLGLFLLLPSAVAAQNFPAKPIKLIVPFPAGGPNDIIARVIGQRMSELSGVSKPSIQQESPLRSAP